jgi:hypothetical protein
VVVIEEGVLYYRFKLAVMQQISLHDLSQENALFGIT